ncbi:MAG: carbohydrate kinase [Verrucomicrobiaceae bacterium]|nr:MAG: carbohydrate kinase [Verrucomicrobiaceae bacterium]
MGMIIGMGELLWDMLPSGPQMGGAPANFACHAKALGAEAMVVSGVGDDPLGHEILRRLDQLGVDTRGITLDPAHATGRVDVELGPDGQPSYTIHGDAAWDHATTSPGLLELAAGADAMCFGTLGQRGPVSRATIRTLLGRASADCLRVLDVNLRQAFFSQDLIHESLLLANVVKLNEDELRMVAPMLGIPGTTLEEQLAGLLARYGLRLAACTRGGEGSLIHDGQTCFTQPGRETRIADTIGAGDSFTSALTLGLLKGWPLVQISETANAVAAHVCSCTGAIPPMPDSLTALFQPTGQPA